MEPSSGQSRATVVDTSCPGAGVSANPTAAAVLGSSLRVSDRAEAVDGTAEAALAQGATCGPSQSLATLTGSSRHCSAGLSGGGRLPRSRNRGSRK